MKTAKVLKFWQGWQWLKREGAVLWRALIDKETPPIARLAALGVILYVISPIDFIPDFIPFVGWIDDLVMIPLGFALVRMLVPEHVWLRAGGVYPERRGKMRGRPMTRMMKDVTPR